MNSWNIQEVNNPAESNVGVIVTVSQGGFVMRDKLTAKEARAVAAALVTQADKVDPPVEPTPEDKE